MTASALSRYDARVTIELARRLLGGGAPASAIEVALMAEVAEGVPFVTALAERFPELVELMERELERSDNAEIHWVRPQPELVQRLPQGLCERLLAVPVHEDPHSGQVDVAAVDVLSPHVGAEFTQHLSAPVRVLRANLGLMRSALQALARLSPQREMSAAARRPSERPDALRMPSEPPIPLVKRPAISQRPEGEPVLNLARSKVFTPEPSFAFELSLDEASSEFARCDSAEHVARAICRALEPAVALVVAVRAGSLEVRATTNSVGAKPVNNFTLPAGKNSVFDIAVRAGFYLGPLPSNPVHTDLRALLPKGAAEEVYSAPVLVASRPVLALLMARFGPSLDATRRADRLLVMAAGAIERILMTKKRGTP
ncbi:MAG: hypothetical protein ACOY0T_25775 [Myxococcota bacterium]